MKIAVIGASGFVGRAIVSASLFKNHYVYAISRSGKFDNHPQLEVVHCDVFDEIKLHEVLKKADLIISSYNAGWTNPNLYQEFMEGSKHIINVVKKLEKRLIVVGGASSLLLSNGDSAITQISAEWKDKVKGSFDLLDVLRKDLTFPWTFISPAAEILPFDTHESYNVGGDYMLYNSKGKSQITVADLAKFIIEQAIQLNNIHKRLTICNI